MNLSVDNKKNIKVGLIKLITALIIIATGYELILFFTQHLYYIIAIQFFIIFIFILWIENFKFGSLATYVKMIIPILYYLGSLSFYLLIPSLIFSHIYIIISSLIFVFIIKNIKNTKRFSENKELFNMNDIYLLITAFLVCSGIFGIYIFLYLPIWALILLCLISMSMLIFQFFWTEKILNRKNLIYIPILSLVFSEITWALSFWPTGFASRGIVLFIIFYFIIGVIKLHLNNRFNRKSIQKYIYVTIIVLVLVLGTTRWYY